jgi:pimeloyl-ACP methyl ester carboxylesterase
VSQTIMFMHGMFLNPKSWEKWQDFFGRRGFETIAPAWPLHEGDPRELRHNVPPGLGELSLDAVISRMVEAAAPHKDVILVGHSVGGLLVQILVNRGIARLGVPICSIAPNGMLSFDWGFFRNSAVITNPLKGDQPFPMDADGFHKNFGNTMPRSESDAAYEQYAMHESRNVLRDCMGDAGKVDVDRPHVPLLFVSADKDAIVPTELCAKNAKAYTHEKSRADYMEFKERGHYICGQSGWEEVATYIANWIEGKG